MLGRRNLRIKVMQTLYAWEMDHDTPITELESQLNSRIEKSTTLYLINLLYLIETCRYSMVDKAKRLSKYIQTDEDHKAGTTIAANRIIAFLENDAQFNSLVKNGGIRNYVSDEIVKKLFAELSSKAKYKEYNALEKPELEQDMEIIQLLLKKVLAINKDLEHYLEEQFTNYDDDNALLLHVMGKYIDGFAPEGKNVFLQGLQQWEDERKFAVELLAKTIQNNEELIQYIQPKLKNWELDRVAVLDMVLLKLAVSELKYFPTIPVKVTINEYIDISKLYSTPKSKDFVNGVLDKVKNEMQAKGEIKKFGRGLVE